MICEAYDDDTLCARTSNRVVDFTWTHDNHEATFQSHLCEDHYQSFKAEASDSKALRANENTVEGG